MPLELRLWREACRASGLADFALRALPMLRERLGVSECVFRRLDPEHHRLESVAAAALSGETSTHRMRTEIPEDLWEELGEWCQAGRPRRGVELARLGTLLVPSDLVGDVLVAPLSPEGGPAGVIALLAEVGKQWTGADVDALHALNEPLAMAFQLDLRWRELQRLREAAEADNRALLSRLGRQDIVERIVGSDVGLRHVMRQVDQVAPTDAPVVILGETGSGKEVVARAIHSRSRRGDGPVLRVNCGAIPPEIIDSELFGHEKGSFTGAVAARKGWFERADGGTLFLDEIGELPLAAQVRLLRVLQDGSFERVGGQRTVTVDVRIIAATHMNLPEMVQAGSFRKDLWYRLSVFMIRLPGLREHPEDIPELSRYFAARVGRRLTGTPLIPTRQDLNLLMAYDWPGNVRELSALIERAAILGNCQHLDVRAALSPVAAVPEPRLPLLDPTFQHAPHPSTRPSPRLPEPDEASGPASLEAAMKQHIVDTLVASQGRIEGRGGAAALLDIHPQTLRSRMRKLGIDWSAYRG